MDARALKDQRERQHHTIQGMWYAMVVGPAPLLTTDPLYVVIPDTDPNTKWQAYWSPKPKLLTINVAQGAELANEFDVTELDLPTVGSECLVVFDNRQNLWVIQWI